MKKKSVGSKLIAVVLIGILVFGTALSVTGAKKIKSKSVTLDATKVTLSVGDIATLDAQMKPINSTDSMKWTSSKTKVATVNKYGTVTAKAVGTTVVKVKTSSGKTAKCTVTVKKNLTEKDVNAIVKEKLQNTDAVSSDWKDGAKIALYDGQKLPLKCNGVTIDSVSIKKYHYNQFNSNGDFSPYKFKIKVTGKASGGIKSVRISLKFNSTGIGWGTSADVRSDGSFVIEEELLWGNDQKEFYINSIDTW